MTAYLFENFSKKNLRWYALYLRSKSPETCIIGYGRNMNPENAGSLDKYFQHSLSKNEEYKTYINARNPPFFYIGRERDLHQLMESGICKEMIRVTFSESPYREQPPMKKIEAIDNIIRRNSAMIRENPLENLQLIEENKTLLNQIDKIVIGMSDDLYESGDSADDESDDESPCYNPYEQGHGGPGVED